MDRRRNLPGLSRRTFLAASAAGLGAVQTPATDACAGFETPTICPG